MLDDVAFVQFSSKALVSVHSLLHTPLFREAIMQTIKTFKLICRLSTFCLVMTLAPFCSAADVLDPNTLMQQLGINESQISHLEGGETVAFEIDESLDRELATGIAMYLPAKPSELVKLLIMHNLTTLDTQITASGAVGTPAKAEEFRLFGFSAKQSDQADRFLKAESGTHFNLSVPEIESIKTSTNIQANNNPEKASQIYRNILTQRLEAYRKKGLPGIAPYSRRAHEEVDNAADLRKETLANKILAHYFPELYKVWLDYPSTLPMGAKENFFWLNRKVENRPTAILAHRIIFDTGKVAVVLARQFYVGHSYNTNQLTIGCLPYKAGSLVFYANRTTTDQVAGIGKNLKHSIGRKQMQSEMIKRLKIVQKLVGKS